MHLCSSNNQILVTDSRNRCMVTLQMGIYKSVDDAWMKILVETVLWSINVIFQVQTVCRYFYNHLEYYIQAWSWLWLVLPSARRYPFDRKTPEASHKDNSYHERIQHLAPLVCCTVEENGLQRSFIVWRDVQLIQPGAMAIKIILKV